MYEKEKKILGRFLGLSVLLIMISFLEIRAQNIGKKGVKLFEKGNYIAALNLFESLRDTTQINDEWISYIVQCHFELYQPENAYKILKNLPKLDSINTYHLIQACFQVEAFDEASKLLDQYQWSHHAVREIEKKINRAQQVYADEEGFVVQNFGAQINSINREYCAVSFNHYNTLLYTSRSENNSKPDMDGFSFESIYQTSVDSTNNWQLAIALTTEMEKEKRHDATVQVYSKGKRMVSYHDGQLYSSVLKNGEWEIEKQLKFHDEYARDSHCFITEDEQTIYFSSDFQSGGANLDLYQSKKEDDGNWSIPEPLTELNTVFDEDSPFLSKEGILYFSSRGHQSIGGFDIFKSSFDDEKQRWESPINMGYPINSVGEDLYYSTHGKLGYFTSSRSGGFGSLDLYRLFLFNKVEVKGQVVSKNGHTPIANVEVNLEYDSIFIRGYTNINGNYKMYMPINKEIHIKFIKDSLNIHEEDYIINVFFEDENNNEFNFFIGSDSSDPHTTVDLNIESEATEIKIDIRNDFNKNPLIAAIPKSADRLWVDSLNKMYEFARPLERRSGVQILYFDFDSYELSNVNVSILDSLVAIFPERETVIFDIQGYADSRGTKDYNYRLSWQRANTVNEYFIKKNISENNVIIKGLGSPDPLKHENYYDDHSKNRRVEIEFHD